MALRTLVFRKGLPLVAGFALGLVLGYSMNSR